jgi:hypothetical protein
MIPIGQQIANVPRENFHCFMDDLVEYCPSLYFFDSGSAECKFANEGKLLKLPQKSMYVVYQEYRTQCCKPCTSCSGAHSENG